MIVPRSPSDVRGRGHAGERGGSLTAADQCRLVRRSLATCGAVAARRIAGVVASMQPNFLQWAGEGGVYERVLGTDARGRNNRFRDVVDTGVVLAFGSDTMPIGPLHGIHRAVDAPHDSQRVSVDEALAAYTRGAAYAEHAEDDKGTLEAGMLADAAVLSADPYEDSVRIDDVDVDVTVLGGEVVFDRRVGNGH